MAMKKTLMLVDDEENSLFALQRMLEVSGDYDVLSFLSAREAIKKTREFIPDLIISDIAMPEMDGIEFCKKIRQNDLTKTTPFIFLTAKKEKMIEGFKAGGDDFLLKPFTLDEVIVKIEAIFRRVKNTKEQISQFKGKLTANGLDKILQICHEKNISGEILLQQEGDFGKLILEKGEVAQVDYQGKNEDEALDILREWDSGVFVVKPMGIKLKPELFMFNAPEKRTGNINDAIEIAKDVFWVGSRIMNASFPNNVFLRKYKSGPKEINLLIDPGPPLDFPVISKKIAKMIKELSNIHLYSLNHQNPDVCMNSVFIRNANAKAVCLTTEDSWRFIKNYEIPPDSVKFIETFKDLMVKLPTGHTLKFILSPFCYAKGSFLIYDVESRVLFTGDLFGGFVPEERKNILFAEKEDWEGIRKLHQTYMPSQQAIRSVIEKIKNLEPAPLMIAPQHGNLLSGKWMKRIMERLYFLDVGADFIEQTMDEEKLDAYIEACNELLEYGANFIERERFDEKIAANAQLAVLCEIENEKVKKMINKPKVVFEQIAVSLIENENITLVNQIQSMALKISRSHNLPAPVSG
jgi:CheY-like chemotaxis protein/glyoxylase-like metal-dependent hydrolase (beta-lactamase superfamily II)